MGRATALRRVLAATATATVTASASASALHCVGRACAVRAFTIARQRLAAAAACFAKKSKRDAPNLFSMAVAAAAAAAGPYFPSAFFYHAARINRPKERDTETVFDSKPSSPVQ